MQTHENAKGVQHHCKNSNSAIFQYDLL
jgi:hypothetical protein